MTLEMGKPIAESKAEIAYAAEFFRWFSGEALRMDGYYKVAGNGASRVLVMRQPIGPCYFITPWNFPTAMGTRKIGPAVAAGCTMVASPRSRPRSRCWRSRSCCRTAGCPRASSTWSRARPRARSRSRSSATRGCASSRFTGSTEVGRKLIAQSADNVLKVSMELGGNAPFLIFDDADVDDAVEGAMIAKMRNIGEACTSANRFHVAEAVADEFARSSASGWAR